MFWSRRIKIGKIIGVFLLIGLLFGIIRPVEYESNTELLPEARGQSSVGSIIQQYGGFLGLGGGANVGLDGGIPPKLYPDIVQSLPYLIELSSTRVRFSEYDTTVTVHNFFDEVRGFTAFDFVEKMTIRLPGTITNFFSSNQDKKMEAIVKYVEKDSIVSVSRKQMKTIRVLRDRITVELNDATGTVSLLAEMPDPNASAELAQAGVNILKKYLKDYRTEKAKMDLLFVQEQLEEAKRRFDEAQNRLAEFRDSNLNLATAKAQTRLQELQSQYDLTFNLYQSLSQRLEEAKLKVQEETPVFSVLQPVTIPLNNSKPNWIIIFGVATFLGLLVGCSWALFDGLNVRSRLDFSG